MEQPKARLTLQQHQQAINEAIWIDASPHEWPTVDKMWLLCSALIGSVQMVDYLRSRLAAVEAERDAAQKRVQDCETRMMRYAIQLGEMQSERDAARAEAEARVKQNETQIRIHFQNTREWKEALKKAQAAEARAVEALRRCHEGAARQLAEPRDHDDDQYALTAIATDCEAVLAAQGPALDWLDQQRREAAAEALEKLATDLGKVPWGSALHDVDWLQSILRTRAAEIRAGEVGDE